MASNVWVSLDSEERELLRLALSVYAGSDIGDAEAARTLTRKLTETAPYPDITVGVYGGQVQWTSGNPFPIRVCDYDGDGADLPNVDESGERCRMWFEPADEREASLRG